MCQSVEIFCCCSLYGNVSWFFLQRVFIFFERVHRQAHGRYLKGILVALSRRCSCAFHNPSIPNQEAFPQRTRATYVIPVFRNST